MNQRPPDITIADLLASSSVEESENKSLWDLALPWNDSIIPEKKTGTSQAELWKALGRCEKCGELLPMTAFGMGDCRFKGNAHE